MRDDWDSVSSSVETQDDSWDAVSTPQPQRPKVRQPVRLAIPRRFVLLGLAGLLIAALASGITWFAIYHVSGIHTANSMPTATVGATVFATQPDATATTQTTATVQGVTAITPQQIYTQDTSGTPTISDPLSDDRNSWAVLTTNWGGQCAFTGGAYHITLSNPGSLIECTGGPIASLGNNFALQVQLDIQRGNEAAIVFGDTHRTNAYRVDINLTGAYTLYEYITPGGWQILQNGFSPAIITGLNQSNVATIIMNNKNFYFFVNAQNVINVNLSGYLQGNTELAAQSDNQATDVAFSNLKVWML